jgi:TP901 family phage tail tape measure protein
MESDALRVQNAYARLNNLPVGASAAQTTAAQERLLTSQQRLSKSQSAMQAGTIAANTSGAKYATAQNGMGMMMAGAAVTGIGLLGASAMKGWIDAAMKMEVAMNNVGIATVNVKGQLTTLNDLQNTAYVTAGKTQFSAIDVMNMAQLAAVNGLNNRASLNAALPLLARGAEIAKIETGSSYQDTVPALVQLSHMFQKYGGKGMNDNIQLAVKSMLLSGATPNELVHTMAYLMPAKNMYGMPASDIFGATALSMNVGLAHGRGGSRIAAMFRAISPTFGAKGSTLTKHNEMLTELQTLGGGTFFKDGKFAGFTNMLEVTMRGLSKIHNQATRMALAGAVFGSAGAVTVSSLASQGAVNRWGNISQMLGPNGLPDVNKMQAQIAGTSQGQLTIFRTNLASIATIMGTQLLPAFHVFVSVLATVTTGIMNFLRANPALVQFVAIFVAITTAAALIAGPIMIAVGAIWLLNAAGALMGIAFLPITLIILGIAAAIAAVVLVIMHWSDITKFFGSLWKNFSAQIGDTIQMFLGPFQAVGQIFMDIFGPMIQGFVKGMWDKLLGMFPILQGVVTLFQHWGDVSKWISGIFDGLGQKVHDLAVSLGLIQNPATKSTYINPGADAAKYKPGQVQATHVLPGDGTVGMKFAVPHVHMPPPAHTGHGGHGGSGGVHFHTTVEIHGADSQTAEELGKKITPHVVKAHSELLRHAVHNTSIIPHSLIPGYN